MKLFVYLVFANVSITLFYGLYRLILARETFFKLNRVYLLATLVFSFAVPCLSIIHLAPVAIPKLMVVPVSRIADVPSAHSLSFQWYQCLIYVYTAGVVISTGLVIKKLIGLRRLLVNPSRRAFTFFKWKVVDSRLPDYALINAHEQAHVDGLHTIDILLFELAAILLWFNPVICLLKTEIKSVHEYLADQAAIRQTDDVRRYAFLLLNGAMGISPALTHSFKEKSLLKKRIYMLQRSQSSRWTVLKYLLVLPLLGLTILLSSWANISHSSQPNLNGKNIAPEFPGGVKQFTAYITNAVKHSAVFTQQIIPKPVMVSFVVDVDGSVTSVTTAGSVNQKLNQEVIHILENCPKWHPGIMSGVPVKVQYQINLSYKQGE